MAAPVFDSVTKSSSSSGSTESVVTFATAAAGDLIIGLISADSGAGAMTWPSPWVEIKGEAGTGFQFSAAYLIATGGETSVTVTHGAERSNNLAGRILAANWHGTTPPEISANANGSSDSPDPPSLTPSWGSAENLWVAIQAADQGSDPFPVTGWPTNYSGSQTENNDINSAGVIALATRLLTATSEDPGAFTNTGSETWNAYTLAVRPAVAAGGSTVSGAATLAANATVASVASPTLRSTTALAGAAALAAAPAVRRGGAASLAASAIVSGTATLTGVVLGAASIAAQATVGATASLTLRTGISMAAAAQMAALASVTRRTGVALSATATLAALASPTIRTTVALSGVASVGALASRTLRTTAPLSSQASLAALARMDYGGQAAPTATATIYAAGNIVGGSPSGPPGITSLLTLKVGR
ncbi:MAG: hypothetical protein IT345_10700 [Trueperaceae bacterium]|nr:hypothetical protein [Trueperaceae bacterium]